MVKQDSQVPEVSKGGGGGVSGGLKQIRIRVEQVLRKFSGVLKKILG